MAQLGWALAHFRWRCRCGPSPWLSRSPAREQVDRQCASLGVPKLDRCQPSQAGVSHRSNEGVRHVEVATHHVGDPEAMDLGGQGSGVKRQPRRRPDTSIGEPPEAGTRVVDAIDDREDVEDEVHLGEWTLKRQPLATRIAQLRQRLPRTLREHGVDPERKVTSLVTSDIPDVTCRWFPTRCGWSSERELIRDPVHNSVVSGPGRVAIKVPVEPVDLHQRADRASRTTSPLIFESSPRRRPPLDVYGSVSQIFEPDRPRISAGRVTDRSPAPPQWSRSRPLHEQHPAEPDWQDAAWRKNTSS